MSLKLKRVLQQNRIKQAALAAGVRLSAAALSQLINQQLYPRTLDRDEVEQRIIDWLHARGVTGLQLIGLFKPDAATAANDEENPMLLRKQTLSPQARQHFRLLRDPFSDPQNAGELFVSADIRYVRESLYQVTRGGVFLALVGESGSGKSTIRKDLIARLEAEQKPVIVIEPYVLGMEDNDKSGKTLKSAHICEAILAAVSPGTPVPVSSERRFRAVHNALRESSRMGNKHVLLIEEAHSLPIPTLKHLKRFFELEDGFEKLLSIVLIGQSELGSKLSESRPDVREVVQRCELVHLAPLGEQLPAYLQHRFQQAGAALADVVEEAAVEALREKLTGRSGRNQISYSVLYPLAIQNILTAAMNLAARLGAPKVTADVLAEV